MSRSEKLLTVLLIIFVAMTLALVALLFAYNFMRTEGQLSVPMLVDAVELDNDPSVEEENDQSETVLANVGASLAEALAAEPDEAEEEDTEPELVDAYTRIIFERNYVLDGIILTSEEPIPHFGVNMDRENLARIYGEWDIIDFTPRLVTMRRNIVGRHAEHYVVSEYDGFVAVFVRSGGAPLQLIETTRTPVSSLSISEQARIREGIIVSGEEALLRVIQDYES